MSPRHHHGDGCDHYDFEHYVFRRLEETCGRLRDIQHHLNHLHPKKRKVIVSLVLSDAAQVTLTAVAYEADGTTPDPNATITWSVDDESVVTVTDNGSGSALAVAGSDGTANVTATAADPDGNTISAEPFAITVVNEATDAKTVAVTAGTPEPKAGGAAPGGTTTGDTTGGTAPAAGDTTGASGDTTGAGGGSDPGAAFGA